ncbi:MAG: hypothetical protein ACI8T1_001488, partial [Verrucomicrobiales bacterium]
MSSTGAVGLGVRTVTLAFQGIDAGDKRRLIYQLLVASSSTLAFP